MTSKPEDLLIHRSSTALPRRGWLAAPTAGWDADRLSHGSFHRRGVAEPPVVLIVRGGHQEAFCFLAREKIARGWRRAGQGVSETHDYRHA